MQQTLVYLLSGRFTLCQLNCTSHGAPMKPAICINTKDLTGELLQLGGLLDGFQQREEAYREMLDDSVSPTSNNYVAG